MEWEPLPEIVPPAGAEACDRCELSGQRNRVIWAEGDENAPMLLLLDNPGARELPTGESFVCGTRQTLRQALQGAGVSEGEVYVTWVLKCRPRRAYDKPACRSACRPYLGVQAAGRRVVVCLGNTALQAYLQDPSADVKALRGRLLPGVPGPAVVCSYHPLAVRRRPNLYPMLVADLQLAANFSRPS